MQRFLIAFLLFMFAGWANVPAHAASGTASNSTDLNNAMNALPPHIHDSLQHAAEHRANQSAAGPVTEDATLLPALGPDCTRLRADIDSARHDPPAPMVDVYPDGPPGPGRSAFPKQAPRSGMHIEAPGPYLRSPSAIEYSRRARLEARYYSECQ